MADSFRKWLLVLMVVSLFGAVPVAMAQKEHGGAESSGPAAPMEPPLEHRPSPAEQQQMMQQAMGGMMGLMMESMARSMAKPEFAQNMATFMRNYYKALIAQGFTEEEALKIVTSGGAIPQMGGRK